MQVRKTSIAKLEEVLKIYKFIMQAKTTLKSVNRFGILDIRFIIN